MVNGRKNISPQAVQTLPYVFIVFFYSISCLLAFRMHYYSDYIAGQIVEAIAVVCQCSLALLYIVLLITFFKRTNIPASIGLFVWFVIVFISFGFPIMGVTRYYDSLQNSAQPFYRDVRTPVKEIKVRTHELPEIVTP